MNFFSHDDASINTVVRRPTYAFISGFKYLEKEIGAKPQVASD